MEGLFHGARAILVQEMHVNPVTCGSGVEGHLQAIFTARAGNLYEFGYPRNWDGRAFASNFYNSLCNDRVYVIWRLLAQV